MSVLQNKVADSGLDIGYMHIHTHYSSALMHSIESLSLTHLELLSCPELHSILRLVLKAGNYMNAVSTIFFQLSLPKWNRLFLLDLHTIHQLL